MINQEKDSKAKKIQNHKKNKNSKKVEHQSTKAVVENELKSVNPNVQEDSKFDECQIKDFRNNSKMNNTENNIVEQTSIVNKNIRESYTKTDVNNENIKPAGNTDKILVNDVRKRSTERNSDHSKPQIQSHDVDSDAIDRKSLESEEKEKVDTNTEPNVSPDFNIIPSIKDALTEENNIDVKEKVDAAKETKDTTTFSNTQSSEKLSIDVPSGISQEPTVIQINQKVCTVNGNKENVSDNGKHQSIENKKRKDKGKKNQPKKTETITNNDKNTRPGNDVKQVSLEFLNGIANTDEQFKIICKKYSELYQKNCTLQSILKENEKKNQTLQKEKEILQLDNNRHIITREKLESLCRELQKQNKTIKEESLKRICEEEEKRKDVSMKFKNTLNEISTLMQESSDKNVKLRDDNLDITKKFKQVVEQSETREQELLEYKTQCAEMQKTEISLRSQISMYSEKYDEFQQTLSRSNEIFAGFKSEMEKMSSKITNLEKETLSWKQRWERSHEALLEMATDKQKSDQELATTARQLAALLKLCRTLQSERIQILAQINRTGNSEKNPPQTDQEEFSKTDATLQQITSLFNKNIENPAPEQDGNKDKFSSSETSATPKDTRKEKKSAKNKQ